MEGSAENLNSCTLYFSREQNWMPIFGQKEATLNCPKCGKKVGSFSWWGLRCSCGEWIVPGFSFPKSKVDPINVNAKSNDT